MDKSSEKMTVEKAWELLRKTQYLSDLDWDVEFRDSSYGDTAQKTSEFGNTKEKPIPSDEGCSSHSHKSETHHHLYQDEASSSHETDTTRNSASLIESRVSIHQANFVVKEEPDCLEIKEEPMPPFSCNISCEEPVKSETLGEEIKEPTAFEIGKEKVETLSAGSSSHIFQSDIIDPLFKRKTSSFDETDTRSSASVMESRVSINQTNIVVKEEPAGIEVKDEPISPLSSSILCEEPVKNETLHVDILFRNFLSKILESDDSESLDFISITRTITPMISWDSSRGTRICPLKKEKESEEGGESSVDPLPVSGSETPQVEMYPYVEAAETRVSGMKDELEINSFVSFQSDAPGQLSLDTKCGSYIAETQRPVMTQMDSTRELNIVTSGLETAPSSSQSPSAEAAGMSTQKHSSVLLQNLHSRTSFVMASCFTATDRYLLERQDEEHIAGARQRQEEEQMAGEKQRHEEVLAVGVRQKTLDNQSGSERGVSVEVTPPKWEMQKCASVSCSNEKGVRKSKGKAFECSACKKSFPSKRVHTVGKAYMCSLCKKSFSHIHPATLHSGEKPYNCSQCQKSFSPRDHLKIHMRLHSGEKPFQCSLCKKSFSQRGHLDRHMRLHTGDKPYNCSQCQKSFSRRGHLDSHMRLHTREKPYKCTRCKKSFSERSTLTKHMRLHTGEKPYKCSLCKKSFSERSTLTRHMRLHTGEKPFQCSQCENSFRHKQSLTLHMRLHTGEKPYGCSLCEKSFSERSHLTRHMRLHTGEKPYNCSQYQKAFSRRDCLKIHLRCHTGEKPFQCILCENSFRHKHHLTAHLRLHTGEKPYNCNQCQKSFSRRDHLKIHMHHHTREEPFQCCQCKKSYAHGDVLTRHMRNHNGEKPLQLSQCKKSFRDKSSLTRHTCIHK